MRTLSEHIYNKMHGLQLPTINEGGAAGHMAHVIDWPDYTCQDLMDLVRDIFSSKVVGITEKLDGTNIMATMNEDGEVVFIRNKTDLNRQNGGMTIDDMKNKWSSNIEVQNNFIQAGEIITLVFNKIGSKWFNPDENTKKIINCECISAGQTNIMFYGSSCVSFHNIQIFKRGSIGWEHKLTTKDGIDVLDKACEGIDKAHLTPQVVVRICDNSKKLIDKYIGELKTLFAKKTQTIDDWKWVKFENVCKLDYPWCKSRKELYARFFNDDKSINLRELKKMNPGHETEIDELCKEGYKKIVQDVMAPLDKLFIHIGNDVIKLCDGLTNTGTEAETAVQTLQQNLKDTVAEIKAGDSDDAKARLQRQLERMSGEDNSLNPAEGIVFTWKGRLCKLTGNFGALNQILGSIKFGR